MAPSAPNYNVGNVLQGGQVVDARFSGNGGLQSTRDNMARGEDTHPVVLSNHLEKLKNGITIKAQHVINQCKGSSGLLKVGI